MIKAVVLKHFPNSHHLLIERWKVNGTSVPKELLKIPPVVHRPTSHPVLSVIGHLLSQVQMLSIFLARQQLLTWKNNIKKLVYFNVIQ